MSHLNKKTIGAGAALVALSAVVPNLSMTDKMPSFGFIGDALAQATSKTTLNVKAKISNPLKITEADPLDFKTFATGGAGKYEITTGGAAGATSKVVVISGPAAGGKVDVEAPQNATFSLSITNFAAGSVKVKTAGAGGATPSKTMTVKTIVFAADPAKMAANTKTYKNAANKFGGFKITDTSKTGEFKVGGTIYFTGDQVEGDYTGTYNVIQSLI